MKILFVLSRDVMFFHGSGEVEAKLLQIGVQLLGCDCHIAGLDSGDFSEYDVYFLFSIRDDVLCLLKNIPTGRPCVIVPQVDHINSGVIEYISENTAHLGKVAVLARSVNEYDQLKTGCCNMEAVKVEGWFLKPFMHEVAPAEQTDTLEEGYCLCMVSADRDEGLGDFAKRWVMPGSGLRIVSDRPQEHQHTLGQLAHVIFEKRTPYGSEHWYSLLANCTALYEPNPRLTCSLLEALWLGKQVFSPHAKYLNAMLGYQFVSDSMSIEKNRIATEYLAEWQRIIYKYHVNFVVANILRIVTGETDD